MSQGMSDGRMEHRIKTTVALAVLTLAAGGCEQVELTVPSAAQVEGYYSISAQSSVSMNGNVAEVTVYQGTAQLRRGGTLWAKVGPYIYLLSSSTRDVIVDFPGLAGVRVITRAPGGTEVARALLVRDAFNELTWRRALNVSGLARRDGTQRPALIEDLIRFAEDRTDFKYNPSFIRSR